MGNQNGALELRSAVSRLKLDLIMVNDGVMQVA